MTSTQARIREAVRAGSVRDYARAIRILEELAASGKAEGCHHPDGGAVYERGAQEEWDEGSSESHAHGGDGTQDAYPEIYLYLARAYHAQRQYARAVTYATVYSRRVPRDGAGWFFLGRSYLALHQGGYAVAALRRSVRENPASLEAQALLGLAYLRSKKPRAARMVFEQALAQYPDNKRLNAGYLNSLFVEAVQHLKRGSADLARQMFTFLINQDVDGVAPRLYLAHAFRSLKHFPEALTQYRAASAFAPHDTVLKWYEAAMLVEMGCLSQAAALLSTLGVSIERDQISDRFLVMGAVRKHMEEGAWARAASAAHLYLKTFGGSVEIHLLMAEVHRRAGRVNVALNHYTRAMKIEPKNCYPHYGLMVCLQEARRWQELAKAIRRAEGAGCDAQDCYYYRVITAAHLSNPPEEVLPHLQELARGGKADQLLFNALGVTYVRLGMADLALRWYEKTLLLDAEDEEACVGLIACYETLCDDARAYTQYGAYLSRWRDNRVIRKDFIAFLERTERWSEAADHIELLASGERGGFWGTRLAFARKKAGQYRQAAIIYRALLRQRPDERVLLHNLVYCLDKMGQADAGLRLLRAACNAFGTSVESRLIEGVLCLHTRRINAAIRTLRAVLEQRPGYTAASELLAKAYALASSRA
ncbi:conserved hypothetical protein [Treponema paraluiscuniculi Cuniculi A]|uniref:Tetratricopeptide repeat protein n=3 Tax=Treponema paraluiscuniculi TaxID=53435 RepID=F7XRT9_TREPU|nr:tetratricopeptide repeat protein [Treponema paraluiscuniculi]AEH40051.1 conserved hypothetical protein [Treponema paraluiscuniculi Cuniculi A]WKC71984.1 hypothetical protein TPLL2_0095 [Treponema paraluiscuniculi]